MVGKVLVPGPFVHNDVLAGQLRNFVSGDHQSGQICLGSRQVPVPLERDDVPVQQRVVCRHEALRGEGVDANRWVVGLERLLELGVRLFFAAADAAVGLGPVEETVDVVVTGLAPQLFDDVCDYPLEVGHRHSGLVFANALVDGHEPVRSTGILGIVQRDYDLEDQEQIAVDACRAWVVLPQELLLVKAQVLFLDCRARDDADFLKSLKHVAVEGGLHVLHAHLAVLV